MGFLTQGCQENCYIQDVFLSFLRVRRDGIQEFARCAAFSLLGEQSPAVCNRRIREGVGCIRFAP